MPRRSHKVAKTGFFHMIQTLTISNFRNHVASRVHTGGAKTIIITGPNGSGKTSILEAISTLSAGSGLRSAKMDEILTLPAASRHPSAGGELPPSGFGVVAQLQNETQLSVSWNAGETHRRARADGDNIPLSSLSEHLRMIWITPREDRIFMDDKSDRRQFFDRLVSAFDPKHSGRTARLSKLLSERAHILKSRCSASESGWLCAIEKQIAEVAVAVAAARVKYVGEINFFLSDAGYKTSIKGRLEQAFSTGKFASEIEHEYIKYLSNERPLVHDKMTIDGAHKSDFYMHNESLNMDVSMTSTGQQKSALITLVVAHAKLIAARTGAVPLILLDEAAAHLDLDARKNLFDALSETGAQVWATGIDASLFDGIDGAKFIACENGTII